MRTDIPDTEAAYVDDAGPDRPDPGGPPSGRRRRLPRLPRPTNLDLRNTWQIVAGAVLLPLGIAFILLAWSGAAHGRVDQQQLPYLISGGLGGLAVVMIGCFFYWAHWLYRLYDQADLHHEEAMFAQRELIRQLTDALAAAGGRPAVVPGPASAQPPAPEGVAVSTNGSSPARTFVATPTGTNFHAPGCPMVANRAGSLRPVSEADAARMRPCRVCEPLVSTN